MALEITENNMAEQIEMQDITRQRDLAKMLLQKGMTDNLQGQMVSGRYVGASPWEGIAKVYSSYKGGQMLKEADRKQTELAKLLREQGVQESQDILSLMRGREGRPEVIPQGQTLLDDQGMPTYGAQRGVSAIAPDLEAAYARSVGARTTQGQALAPLLAKQLMPDLTPEEKRYKAARADGSFKGGFNDFLNQLTEKDKANLAIERAKLADQGIYVSGVSSGGGMPSSGTSMVSAQGGGQRVTGDAKYMPANMPVYQPDPTLTNQQNRELQAKFAQENMKNVKNAKDAFGSIKAVSEILRTNDPSSGFFENVITGTREMFGGGGKQSQADAKLKVLGQKLVQQVPRFEGPQSDKDVASYQAAAGDIGNPNRPIAARLAALQTLVDLNKKYYPNGDWDSINLETPTIRPNMLGGTNTYFGATVDKPVESGWRVKVKP
jgi:hypothetical protein